MKHKNYSKFTFDRFFATCIFAGAMFHVPRACVPLLFSSGFNLSARYGFNSIVGEGKWNITQDTADTLTSCFSIFSSISVEYLRPPIQTALSNYVAPKYAAIGGKITALAFSNVVSAVHKDLWLPSEKRDQVYNTRSFPILEDAGKYLLFLAIREASDQFLPRVYGYKPFGVVVASSVMYGLMAKTVEKNDGTKAKESRLQHVCRKTLDFMYNQLQMDYLVKVPLLVYESLLKYIIGDILKKIFSDYIAKPVCKKVDSFVYPAKEPEAGLLEHAR